jgi:hypothetical protein
VSSAIGTKFNCCSARGVFPELVEGAEQVTIDCRPMYTDPAKHAVITGAPMGVRRLGTKSSQTLRWREMDSNFQFRCVRQMLRLRPPGEG